MTVLQSDAEAVPASVLPHKPVMVITGASGGTLAASGFRGKCSPGGGSCFCVALAGGAAGVDGVCAWPQAKAPSSRHSNPYRVITGVPPRRNSDKLRNKNPQHKLRGLCARQPGVPGHALGVEASSGDHSVMANSPPSTARNPCARKTRGRGQFRARSHGHYRAENHRRRDNGKFGNFV